MPRVALTQGAYEARSIIANAQRCMNLYPEQNTKDALSPMTHYPTPGLLLQTTAPVQGEVRELYTATNGNLYCVVAQNVYYVQSSPVWSFTLLGTIGTYVGVVDMNDNGLAALLVDGSANGYVIDLATNAFSVIPSNPGSTIPFYGSDRVGVIDTYFVLNRPGTNQFYISLSEVSYANLTGGSILTGGITAPGSSYTNGTYTAVALTGGNGSGATADIVVSGNVVSSVTLDALGQNYHVGDVLSAAAADIGGTGSGFTYTITAITSSAFDPLDIASKIGYSDNIAACQTNHKEIWLFGEYTTEVWYNSGAADFAFQRMDGVFIEHGCAAHDSVARHDLSIYWLAYDRQGTFYVMKSVGYQAIRISTHAIENEFSTYNVINDAIAYIYMQEGHTFYVLTFPAQNRTWVYDIATGFWHERGYFDDNGNQYRHRSNCYTLYQNLCLVGDYQNGNLYIFDLDTHTDNGNPIPRIRSFPHIMNDGRRVIYRQFIADMQVGEAQDEGSTEEPIVSLRWSDTRGASWGNAIQQSIGAPGKYLTSVQFQRLGMARDRVFEISWSTPVDTALNGAFIQMQYSAT